MSTHLQPTSSHFEAVDFDGEFRTLPRYNSHHSDYPMLSPMTNINHSYVQGHSIGNSSEIQYRLHKHKAHNSDAGRLASTHATHILMPHHRNQWRLPSSMQIVSDVSPTTVAESHGNHTTPASLSAHDLVWNGTRDDHIFTPRRTLSNLNRQSPVHPVGDGPMSTSSSFTNPLFEAPQNPIYVNDGNISERDFVATTDSRLPRFIGHNPPFQDGGEWRQPSSLVHVGRYPLSLDEPGPRHQPFPTDHRHRQTLPYDRPSIDPPHAQSVHSDSNIHLGFDVSGSSMHNDFHEFSCSVANGPSYLPSRIPNALSSSINTPMHMRSRYDGGFPISSCALVTPIRSSSTTQTLPAPPQDTATCSPLDVIPLVHQKSEESRPVARSPYHFNRTSPHPDRSSSRTCEWIKDDGTTCGEQIAWKDVPGHLATHGIERLTRNHRTSCRWSGCRRRGSTDKMNRECIVRHVREVHLHCKRSSRR